MRFEARTGVVFLVAFAIRWSPPATAADPPPEAVRDFVLQGMRVSRAALKTGVCRLEMEQRRDDAAHPELSESTASKATLTLDIPHRMRMEWAYPTAVAESSGFVNWSTPPVPRPKTLTGYCLKTRDRNILWFQGNSVIDVTAPASPPPVWADCFDLRAIGFYGWVELSQGVEWEALLDVFQKKPIARAKAEAGDRYTLAWELGSHNAEWVVTVDARRGFAPVKAVMRHRPRESAPWRTVQEFESEWARVSSVWLPVRYRGVNSQGESAVRHIEMTLSWKDVNVPIPDSAFAIESLGAPDSVTVVDSRLGVPVVTKAPRDLVAAADARPSPGFGPRGLSVLILNLSLVVAGVVYAGSRLRTARRDEL